MSSLPSQTVGPFFHFALTANHALGCMAGPEAAGERIQLRITLLDGDGAPVPDGMIELWQADAAGRFEAGDPGFCGFGRLATNREGRCTFHTVRPGRVHGQAAHISVSVFARGLLGRLCTRVYFEGGEGLESDAVLALVPAERRRTLMARRGATGMWDFVIHLQGGEETVFFDV